MWNRRDEDDQRQAPAAGSQPKANGSPYTSAANTQQYEARGTAVIGKSVVIRGEIISDEDLHIDGDLEGSVRLERSRLTIGPNGKVKANIKAREVTIRGSVQGNVETTEKILIHKDGTLVGDIKTAGIVIEDGAYFKGSIDIIRPAAAPKAPPPAHAPAQPGASGTAAGRP